jgi:hypothetical protein
VAGWWKREWEKRRKCSVRFACMQDLKEGLSNAAGHDLCTYISYRDTTAVYHFRRGGPTNGGSLARQTKDRPLMPAHMPWPRDCARHTEVAVRCINQFSGLGPDEYQLASLHG